MKRLLMACAAGLLLPMAAAAAMNPPINGVVVAPRVFNDYPSSSLVIASDNNPFGGSGQIMESNYGTGGFANRHDLLLSADGGATAAAFNIDASWTWSTNITLSAGSVAPAKEAGLRVNSPITGDGLFIVKTNGEIVAFGGGAPFFIASDTYTPGTSISLTMKMTAGGDGIGGVPNFVEYIYDVGAGPVSSGPLVWSNIEFGPLNYNLGVYAQSPPDANNPNDFLSATFTGLTYTAIPEPATVVLAGMGMIGAFAVRRRR